MSKINIAVWDGDGFKPVEVKATVVGSLAVHPAYRCGGYKVTHVATGMGFGPAFSTKGKALSFAKKIQIIPLLESGRFQFGKQPEESLREKVLAEIRKLEPDFMRQA